MADPMQRDGAATVWGVKHSQGIRWCSSEREAREHLAREVAYDERRQYQARGRARLVNRDLGPIVEVENPYTHDSRPADSGTDG